MKVLLIDDEEDVRLLVQVALAAAGMEVVTEPGGAEGIVRARDWQPDVILLDAMMPGMDGSATLAALRADGDTTAIPVLFLSARGRAQLPAGLADEPRVGFLAKPFAPRTLAAAIRSFLLPLPE